MTAAGQDARPTFRIDAKRSLIIPTPTGGKKVTMTILIVEDDKNLLNLLKTLLQAHNYDTITSQSGLEGLQQAYAAQPDLVILDIMLPGMDGWTVCERLREMSKVPILMITARAKTTKDIVRGLKGGADDYLTKPFENQELLARVEALLRRAHTDKGAANGAPNVYSYGGLTIDFDQRKVTLKGEESDLTTKEFDLLSCLVQNANQTLSHKFLLTRVWGLEYSFQIDYLKVYIHRLRQKIEDDPAHPSMILTEWGIGYRFVKNSSNLSS